MARPDSEWVAVAWFSDEGMADYVADYLATGGIRTHVHGSSTRAIGDAPVFVEAKDVEAAHQLLRRLKTNDFALDAEEGTIDALGAQLVKELGPAPDYEPPSTLARWAPLALCVGLVAIMLLWVALLFILHDR